MVLNRNENALAQAEPLLQSAESGSEPSDAVKCRNG